jgi:transcriptional regulator with XRE-family HTH domain
MDKRTELGARIRRRRRDLDMTQAQLAERSGVPQYHSSGIEVGRIVEIKTDTLRKLAQALHCSADYLIGLTDDPQPLKRRRKTDTQGELWPAEPARVRH